MEPKGFFNRKVLSKGIFGQETQRKSRLKGVWRPFACPPHFEAKSRLGHRVTSVNYPIVALYQLRFLASHLRGGISYSRFSQADHKMDLLYHFPIGSSDATRFLIYLPFLSGAGVLASFKT